MPKLRSVQILRGVAVIGVLLCHSHNLGAGSAGVDLFFVISGFIITTVARGRTAREFLVARLRRIYPIYWLAVIPWLFLIGKELTLERAVSTLTLWPAFGSFVRPALPAGWSLCFEMLFYLAAAASMIWGVRYVAGAYALCVVASFLIPSAATGFLGNSMALEFLAGAAIARFQIKLSAWWIVPAVLWFAFAPPQLTIVTDQTIRPLFYGVPAALLFGALWYRDAGKLFDVPVFVGDASYSIYLVHQLVLLFGGGFFIALFAGCSTHLLIERRLISKRTNDDRITRGRPRTAHRWMMSH